MAIIEVCKSLREEILNESRSKLEEYRKITSKPIRLAIIQVEGDAASDVYVKNKLKTCREVGIECDHIKAVKHISKYDLMHVIKRYADWDLYTGVMLQLPLPDHLKPYTQEFLDLIPWQKDVDGLSSESIGRLWSGQTSLLPCTARGVMNILKEDLSGKHVVIVGRSNLVGKPLVKLLEGRNATVTLCHSYTEHLKEFTKSADIVVCAIGKAKYFDASWFKEYAVVIDVGINRDENGKLCGDVDVESLEDHEIFCTPTPGGTGILTTACLIGNVVVAAFIQEGYYGR